MLIVRAALAVAFLLWVGIAAQSQEATPQAEGVQPDQQANSPAKGQQDANPQTEPAKENITVVAPAPINPTQPPVAEKGAAQQANSSEEKAKESWTIAGYAVKITDFFIALFNGFLVIVTVFLVRSTNKLWSESTKATEIARDAANAATNAAEAAMAAGRPRFVVERIAIGLDISGSSAEPDSQLRDNPIRVDLKNHGQAAHVTRECIVLKLAEALDRKPRYPTVTVRQIPFGRMVGHLESHAIMTKLIVSEDDVENIRKKSTRVWVYGYVAYRDFLDQPWKKGFVGALEPGGLLEKTGLRTPHRFTQEGPSTYSYTKRENGDEK